MLNLTAIDALGFAASVTVLASFSMTSIVALRALALLSNVLFLSYGLIDHIFPVLILHTVLLPLNSLKLYRVRYAPAVENGIQQAHRLSEDLLLRKKSDDVVRVSGRVTA